MSMTPTKEEARSELFAAIMNLPCDDSQAHKLSDLGHAYKVGHRDARHAAAELVAAAPLSPAGQAVRMLERGEIIDEISPLSNNSADHDIEFALRVLAKAGLTVGLPVGQPAGREVSDLGSVFQAFMTAAQEIIDHNHRELVSDWLTRAWHHKVLPKLRPDGVPVDAPDFCGLPFGEARKRILELPLEEARGMAISLLIQNGFLRKAADGVTEVDRG